MVQAALGVGVWLSIVAGPPGLAVAALPGGSLDPTTITKYAAPLVIPKQMPKKAVIPRRSRRNPLKIVGATDYYEIAVRQFSQQVLPPGMPATTVWGYGAPQAPSSFGYPARTIEARVGRPVRVKWINDLKDPVTGNFLPHLLPVDQTLMWANPAGPRDANGVDQTAYTGPVPQVVHLHGAHVTEESDGFPEAWFLPDAANIPVGFARSGSWYERFRFESRLVRGIDWKPGTATFEYPNDQRAATLWFHDHTIGMTRQNVYAGPGGFYLLRGGAGDLPAAKLPGPAPRLEDRRGARHYELPLMIQDRSFNADGSLFYPDNRAFFEGLNVPGRPPQFPGAGELRIPFAPAGTLGGGISDIAPIWNPEFFGNTMVVNGRTWPSLTVEPRRYRLRLLNASNSRFLILKIVAGDPTVRPGIAAAPFWQIGSDGGLLPAPVQLGDLLIAPAERADVVVDFTGMPVGTQLYLINEGPDEPFGGGIPGIDFAFADPATTGQVMRISVGPRRSRDLSVSPAALVLPAITPVGPATTTRQVSLNELESKTVLAALDANGNLVEDLTPGIGVPFGPVEAELGTVNPDGTGRPREFESAITENPMLGDTEVWEIHNFTADAHPIHVHQVQFQVVDRQPFLGAARPPEAWESGFKDTLIAYPGEITRLRATFDIPGLFVWHCHILEHEDNEMMRPFQVGPMF